MLSVNRLLAKLPAFVLLMVSVSLAACGSLGAREPVQVVQAAPIAKPEPPKPSVQALQTLAKMNALQSELRQLRGQLEQQQFELENVKQRQKDLFEGLDQRLRVTENVQHNSPPANLPAFPAVAPVLVDHNQIIPQNTRADNNPAQVDAPLQMDRAIDNSTPSQFQGVDQQTIYDQGFEFLKRSRYTDAIAQFTQLLNQYPNGGLADDASYWIGEANYVNRQYEAAINAFRKVVNQYPSSDRVPEALLKVGYVQYDIGDYQGAKQTFEDVIRQYAAHPVANSAKSRLQRIERGIAG